LNGLKKAITLNIIVAMKKIITHMAIIKLSCTKLDEYWQQQHQPDTYQYE